MGRSRDRCCNPFATGHSQQKQIGVQLMGDDLKLKAVALRPQFDWDRNPNLCLKCRTRVGNEYTHLKLLKAGLARAKKAKRSFDTPQSAPIPTTSATTGLPALPLNLPSTQLHVSSPTEAESTVVTTRNISVSAQESQQVPETIIHPTAPPHEDVGKDTVSNKSSSSDVASIPSSPGSIPGSVYQPSRSPSLASDPPTPRDLIRMSVNESLQLENITPIRPSDEKKGFVLRRKVTQFTSKFKSRVLALAGEETNISPNEKKKECKYCNILLVELSEKFNKLATSTNIEKYKVLTCIPKRFTINEIYHSVHCSEYMAEQASKLRNCEGAFSHPTYHFGKPLAESIVNAVKEYYLSSEFSRPSPNSNGCIYIRDSDGQRKEVAKIRILCNLNELYRHFTEDTGMQISVAKFASLRPKNCVWPGKRGYHNTCVCEIHQNFDFMLKAMEVKDSMEVFFEKVLCQGKSTNQARECFSGLCSDCPQPEYISACFERICDEDEVEFYQWKHTDATDLQKVTTTFENFKDLFLKAVHKVVEHDYIYRSQRDFLKTLRDETLRDVGAISVNVDFAQNYSFVIQNAVQGFHWSNRQATLHPFVVHWWDSRQMKLNFCTYCVVSDEMTHDADTFHVFKENVLGKVLQDLQHERFNVVYYVSDGAGGQYKNYKNFANLYMHDTDFGLPAEWHFTATSHGKSTCDAIAGVVKSTTRRESLKPGVYITTPQDMFGFCVKKLTSETLKFLFISKSDVSARKMFLSRRYEDFRQIPGTRKFHMFKKSGESMLMRNTSSDFVMFTKFNFRRGELSRLLFEDLQVGMFYAFVAANMYQVGLLVDTNRTEAEAIMQVMKTNRKTGVLLWSEPLCFVEIAMRDVLCQIEDPLSNDGITHNLQAGVLRHIKDLYTAYKAVSN